MTRRNHALADLSGPYVPLGDRVQVYAPSASRCHAARQDSTAPVPAAEISRLVSLALEDALVALAQPSPESFLQMRACDRRRASRKSLSSLPRLQARDPMLLTEYRKELVFENLALDLGLGIVSAIKRYAKVRGG